MDPKHFFSKPSTATHRQYEALRAFFLDQQPAAQAAELFGYSRYAFYSLVRDFKKTLARGSENPFFPVVKTGRKPKDSSGALTSLIVSLRKKYLSVPDIAAAVAAKGYTISEKYVYNVIAREGFDRLPRRTVQVRQQSHSSIKLEAPKAFVLTYAQEHFGSQSALAVLCLLPYAQHYGILDLIGASSYPESQSLDRMSSVLSFVALKLSHVRRYTADDAWCMDRGLGLFAGLNVLPKAAWFSSYSHRVTREMNFSLLKGLHTIYQNHGLLSDTANLDFTAIPYWGDDSHLENNWSGTRHKGLASILTVIGQDPDSGILTYGDTTLRHDREAAAGLEFLDFSRKQGSGNLRYLIFDSRFTTYENLAKLDKTVKFVTIRRRGKRIVEELDQLPTDQWKRIHVMKSDGKGTMLRVHDSHIFLRKYEKKIRQIAITGHGKVKPALLITNDFDRPLKEILHLYARRWLVEKSISEQIEFFHLNRVSSSMVIKVDFDLTMSILAHNLLRLLAMGLPGYSHMSSQSLFDQFLNTGGSIDIGRDTITVGLKKKRNLPALLTATRPFQNLAISSLENRKLAFQGDTRS
jgi:hypothetical protein|tara:strand:- start:51 stop:1787 length:1737 start_codon:yes stop_codon:yes gene_type:complete